MKMTMYTAPTMVPRQQNKDRVRPGRPGGKRLAVPRSYSGKGRSMIRRSLDPCDNSNDSGLGFDHHVDRLAMAMNDNISWTEDRGAFVKRPKVDVKIEFDAVNDSYSFPEHSHIYRDSTMLIRTPPSVSFSSLSASGNQTTASSRSTPRCLPLINRIPSNSPVTLTSQLQASSRYADISLSIICQPEQQHRARYQTEGSRGAVKDRSGNGFPVVQLTGYNKPATLQVFIGSDQGKVAPHMFYQACKVSGKNSTPCTEKKIDGTIVIELQLEPAKEMQGTCDCVGILKERNVDVEHRFPDQLGSRAKKKSTRCRMVFRSTITHTDGTQETLQVCSQPIVCTQPPGIPEISKKSLTSCPATGGLELFIIGKNFLKDTVVFFQLEDELHANRWEQTVVPDKEFLQQTHLICVVPQFMHPDITEPVTVRLYVMSSGKTSEPHQFVYTPVNGAMPSVRMETGQTVVAASGMQQVPFLTKMMPPPGTNLVPLSQRRLSTASITNADSLSPPMRLMNTLKQEFIDENSQNSVMDPSDLHHRFRHISESSLDVHQGDSNMSMINDNSMDVMRSHSNQMMHSNMNENSNLSIVNENSMEMMTTSRALDVIDEAASHYSPQRSPEVMDLRRKMPMATVADLVHTKEPSMATLQSFGVMEHSGLPLPAQTAQSIESFLTNMETKPTVMQTSTTEIPNSFMSSELLTSRTDSSKPPEIMTEVHRQNPIENTLMSAAVIPSRLDVLVNCAVPQKEDNNVLLSQDVMMPPMINTNLTPPMAQAALTTPTSNISPDVILNTQISPSLMCRNNQDALLPPNNLPPPVNVPNNLLTTANSNLLSVNTPENVIILSAAADLLETQKMLTSASPTEVMPTMTQLPTNSGTMGNNFYTTTADNSTITMDTLAKTIVHQQQEQQQQVKKEEELRMVPPSLVTMSENDLINIINPSCFGQV